MLRAKAGTPPKAMRAVVSLFALAFFVSPLARAQGDCPRCPDWRAPQEPFRIFGNTYYVGTHGISSILIASPGGHMVIDGMEGVAPQIAEHIKQLGFRVEDVKWLGNSHVHYDHAGALAELGRMTRARLAASPWSAAVLTKTGIGKDDPQSLDQHALPLMPAARILKDGETVRLQGGTGVTVHFTPGHTPGGTSWTWRSCEDGRCLSIVYVDSLTAVSSDGYRYSDHPDLVAGFRKSFAFLRSTPCDILLTPHPEMSDLWLRLERRAKDDRNALIDASACKEFADDAEAKLGKRLASER